MTTFSQQLSEAAEEYNADHEFYSVSLAFERGARWTLNSELIKELEAAFKKIESGEATYYSRDGVEPTDTEVAAQALQKLSEARGE